MPALGAGILADETNPPVPTAPIDARGLILLKTQCVATQACKRHHGLPAVRQGIRLATQCPNAIHKRPGKTLAGHRLGPCQSAQTVGLEPRHMPAPTGPCRADASRRACTKAVPHAPGERVHRSEKFGHRHLGGADGNVKGILKASHPVSPGDRLGLPLHPCLAVGLGTRHGPAGHALSNPPGGVGLGYLARIVPRDLNGLHHMGGDAHGAGDASLQIHIHDVPPWALGPLGLAPWRGIRYPLSIPNSIPDLACLDLHPTKKF